MHREQGVAGINTGLYIAACLECEILFGFDTDLWAVSPLKAKCEGLGHEVYVGPMTEGKSMVDWLEALLLAAGMRDEIKS